MVVLRRKLYFKRVEYIITDRPVAYIIALLIISKLISINWSTIMNNAGNTCIIGVAKLTGGSETVRQFVPVHQVGMSISPDTPPSGAPWYANQSTVANVCPFFFSFLPA